MRSKRVLQVFLRGGLGNQLFQYSAGLALAEEQGYELILRGDLLPLIEDTIGGVSRWPNQLSDFHHSGTIRTKSNQPVGKTNLFGKTMQVMRLAGDRSIELVSRLGWLASENNLASIESRIRPISLINSYCPFKELAFKNRERLRLELNQIHQPSQEFLRLASEIGNAKAMVVHLRQGDYTNLSHIFGTSSLDFLKIAVQGLRRESGLENLWLFTDTPNSTPREVLDFLNPQRVISPDRLPRPIENMLLMSRGGGLVAANSSFSWWSAFLTTEETIVIAPVIKSALVNNFSHNSELGANWRTILVG